MYVKLKLSVFIVLCMVSVLVDLYAENPPYAKVVSGPAINGSNIEFTLRLDPDDSPDCTIFLNDCNNNNQGIEQIDIHWFLIARTDCSGCNLDSTVVQSGVIDHGFWGTNCTIGSTASGTDCSNPGGCDELLSIPVNDICAGTEYDLVTYAIDPDYTQGLPEGQTSGAGPYRCCFKDPSVGTIQAMYVDCVDGGEPSWLNPSYPQVFNFDAPGDPNAPNLNVNANLNSGDGKLCGFGLTSSITVGPFTACVQSTLTYKVIVNGDEVETIDYDCVSDDDVFNYDKNLVACPAGPPCKVGFNDLSVACGDNTIRFEAYQNCTDALVAFEEITFTIDCPEADNLELSSTDNILCPSETIDISVETPANVNIPYVGGTYELHWNNSDPYEEPQTNYVGTGQDHTITNDGTYPYNEAITFTGTIWADFDTDAPSGCEEYSGTVAVIMLEEISIDYDNQACVYNEIHLSASGGLPEYDGSNYTFDATDAGAGTNTTGDFTGITQGTYDIIVSDDEDCSTTVQITVYDEVTLTENPLDCDLFNGLSVNVQGGQPFNDYTLYNVTSDIDGDLGSPAANGDLIVTSGLTSGTHTLTFSYEYIDPQGNATGIMCEETIQVEVYEPLLLELSEDPCDFEEQVLVLTASGGQDDSFTGGGLTVFLSTTDIPNANNNVANDQGTLSGAGTFTGVAPGNYFVVLEDGRGCQVSQSVTVTVNDDNFSLTLTIDPCNPNDIEIQTTDDDNGGVWTYYIFPEGADPNDPSQAWEGPLTGTEQSPGVHTGTFTDANPLQNGFVYAENSLGCTTLTETIDIYADLSLSELTVCDEGNILVAASGGYAGASWTNTDYTYTIIETGASNTTGSFSNVSPGSYTVEVNDNHPDAPGSGCTVSISVEVYAPITVDYTSNNCFGDNQITINSITGGLDPANNPGASYTLLLSHDASITPANDANGDPLELVTTDPANDLPFVFDDLVIGETYYIVVYDDRTSTLGGNPCNVSFGPIVFSDQASISADTPTCSDNNNISVSVTGGAVPYDYYVYTQGSPLQGSPESGTYDETAATNGAATDTNGDPLALLDAGANQTFNNVPPGIYTVYSVDAAACQVLSVDVNVYAPLNLTLSNSVCATVDEVEITAVSGGQDPSIFTGSTYTIYLSSTAAPNANNDVSSTPNTLSGPGTFTGITASAYYVVVEDDRGCQYSVYVEEGQEKTLSWTEPVCTAEGGTATLTASGGSPDWNFYLYTTSGTFDAADPENGGNGWIASDLGDGSGTDETGSFSGIAAGNYTVYALDGSGCEATPVAIEVYDDLQIAGQTGSCASDEVEVTTAEGGKGTITVFLSTTDAPNGQQNVSSTPAILNGPGTFTGVGAGNYFLIIEDERACQASQAIDLSGTVVDIEEVAQTDPCLSAGALTVVANGGTPTWTYYIYTSGGTFDSADPENGTNGWLATETGDSNNEATFNDLNPGSYVVYAIDGNGCEGNPLNKTITAGDPLTLTDNSELCNYDELNVNASGGNNASYTYQLFDSNDVEIDNNTSGVFSPLTIGTYYAIVTDADGCTAQLDDLQIVAEPIVITDFDDCGQFAAEGGVGTLTYGLYTFDINPVLIEENTTGQFPDIDAGQYLLYVTDENGCQENETVTCTSPVCSIEAVLTTTCFGLDQYLVVVNLTGPNVYTLSDGINPPKTGETSGSITLGPIPNGPYTITITDETLDDCEEVYTGSEDCFDCGLTASATTTCVGIDSFNLVISLNGNGTFTINDGINPSLTGQTSGDIDLGNFPNGSYSVTVTSEEDSECTETLSGDKNCFDCDLSLTANPVCANVNEYNVSLVLSGTGNYTIDDGINPPLTGQVAGTIEIGPFPNGDYSIVVTSETDAACTETVSGNFDCFECGLIVSGTPECIADDVFNYNVNVTIEGNGSYTIDDGINPELTGQTAGTISVGPFPNGNYSITITSEEDPTCFQTLTGEHDCFECELSVSATTQCQGTDEYIVEVELAGNGTYTINDGINPPLTGQVAGNIDVGPFPNGDYSITVTSETDANCSEILTGAEDCFNCNLNILSSSELCDGVDGFIVSITLVGNGTYTIDDGINPPLTGQSAGIIGVGPIPNGSYSITITSETDPNCVETISGEKDCFTCQLSASAIPNCIDFFNYELAVVISGNGTYTIDDGINPPLTGQIAGTIDVGPIPNGPYNITITSEEDPECSENLIGEKDCFECTLEGAATPNCTSLNEYEVSITFTGEGLFTIDDGTNDIQTGQSAGTYNFGPYISETDYEVTITSEEDNSCVLVLSGIETCFECPDGPSADTECTDFENFEVSFTLPDIGTWKVDDGNNTVSLNIQGGSFFTQTYPNGAYTIVITSEVDPECIYTIPVESDCFTCDLSLSAATECIEDNDAVYNVLLNLNGSGTYSIDYGTGILNGQTEGIIELGPIENGSYNIIVTSEVESDCTATLSGAQDCELPPECDVTVVAENDCIDEENYNLDITLAGQGTFSIVDAPNNINLTNQSPGLITVGPITGNYNITITSESNPDCTLSIEGVNNCEEPFVCDPAASATTECVSLNQYEVQIALTGTGTYTINDGVNPVLTGQTAGIITLGPINNGNYNIEIINEEDPDCSLTLSGQNDCTFDCDILVNTEIICNGENTGFDIEIEIEGGSVYSIDDGINPVQTGLSAGTYMAGPFPHGEYNIEVNNEANPFCTQVISGIKYCVPETECDLQLSVEEICEDDEVTAINVIVEGTGNYNLQVQSGFNSENKSNITAGTYYFEFSSNANTYYVNAQNIFDQPGNAACFENIESSRNCCGLYADVQAICDPEGGYDLYVTIGGDDNTTYDITISEGWWWNDNEYVVNDVSAGTYFFDTLYYDNYQVLIEEDGTNCYYEVDGNTECADPEPCDLAVDTEVECLDNGQFNIIVNVSGPSKYLIEWSAGFGNNGEMNGEEGQYILGPFNSGGFFGVNIEVRDIKQSVNDCLVEISYGNDICDEDCDMDIAFEPECVEEGYLLNITIEGGLKYNINSSTNDYNNVEAGTYSIGPYPEDGNFNFTVSAAGVQGCSQSFNGSTECDEQQPCDLSGTVEPVCNEEGTAYVMQLTLEGSDTYTITYGDGEEIASVSAGTYDIGPFNNGAYQIYVVDDVRDDCFQNFTGSYFCEPPPSCDLELNVTRTCEEDNSGYTIEVQIIGSGTYTLYDNNTPVLTGLTATTVTLGPYDNAETYNVKVQDEANASCEKAYSGTFVCEEVDPCDYTVSVDYVCLNDSIYVNVSITGNGEYTVSPNFGGLGEETIQGGETLKLGPLSDNIDNYNLDVWIGEGENCKNQYYGSINCEASPGMRCICRTVL